MTYKISGATALSLLTTVATTGCLDIQKANPMAGDWAMTSIENECVNYSYSSADSVSYGIFEVYSIEEYYTWDSCFDLSSFSFSTKKNGDSLEVIESEIKGVLAYSSSYTLNYSSQRMSDFTASNEGILEVNEDVYTISTGIILEDGTEFDFVLKCTLTEDNDLDCLLEEPMEAEFPNWHIIFENENEDDSIVGAWLMTSFEDNCYSYSQSEVDGGSQIDLRYDRCVEFSDFSFSIRNIDDVISIETIVSDGSISYELAFSILDEDSYGNNLLETTSLSVNAIEEGGYTISTGVVLDFDGDEATLDFELNCNLTEENTLDCILDSMTLDDDDDIRDEMSDWHIVFEK